jgi:hypothetical protein
VVVVGNLVLSHNNLRMEVQVVLLYRNNVILKHVQLIVLVFPAGALILDRHYNPFQDLVEQDGFVPINKAIGGLLILQIVLLIGHMQIYQLQTLTVSRQLL